MKPEMLQATKDLDDVRIVSPQGYETARIVFKQVLFFEGGNTLDGQLRALTALSGLAEDVAPHLAYMQCAGGTARPEPVDLARFRVQSEDAIRKLHADGPYSDGIDLGLFGREFRTPDNKGVTPFGGSVLAGGGLDSTADISVLEFSTSLIWDAENMFRRQIERVRTAASTVQARFGLAGFGLQYDRIYESTSGSYAYLARFPGLHSGLDANFTDEQAIRKPAVDRYVTINWLTLLCDDMLAELAPPEQLQQELGEARPISRYDNGIIIQAGPYPQLGDINQGMVLDDYRAVNAAIKSLRFEDYRIPVLNAPEPQDSLEATLEWVKRFD